MWTGDRPPPSCRKRGVVSVVTFVAWIRLREASCGGCHSMLEQSRRSGSWDGRDGSAHTMLGKPTSRRTWLALVPPVGPSGRLALGARLIPPRLIVLFGLVAACSPAPVSRDDALSDSAFAQLEDMSRLIVDAGDAAARGDFEGLISAAEEAETATHALAGLRTCNGLQVAVEAAEREAVEVQASGAALLLSMTDAENDRVAAALMDYAGDYGELLEDRPHEAAAIFQRWADKMAALMAVPDSVSAAIGRDDRERAWSLFADASDAAPTELNRILGNLAIQTDTTDYAMLTYVTALRREFAASERVRTTFLAWEACQFPARFRAWAERRRRNRARFPSRDLGRAQRANARPC